jgi:xylan 1,4-beta-xylosidase
VSHDEELGKCLGIMTSNRGRYDEPLEQEVSIQGLDRVYLKASINYEKFQFLYSTDGSNWNEIGPVLDASILSDENAEVIDDGVFMEQGFTGAYIGMCVQDLSGQKMHADFDYFSYKEK